MKSPNFDSVLRGFKSWDLFNGCGGRTRTYDLRVMSPTSFQLLYSAIWGELLEFWDSITHRPAFVNRFFLSKDAKKLASFDSFHIFLCICDLECFYSHW